MLYTFSVIDFYFITEGFLVGEFDFDFKAADEEN